MVYNTTLIQEASYGTYAAVISHDWTGGFLGVGILAAFYMIILLVSFKEGFSTSVLIASVSTSFVGALLLFGGIVTWNQFSVVAGTLIFVSILVKLFGGY